MATILLPRRECARRLGVAPGTWDRLWRRSPLLIRAVHRLPTGGRPSYRWPEEAVEAFIESCRARYVMDEGGDE